MVLADDFLVPDCLEKMVQLAESDSRIGVVSSYQQFATIVGNVGLPFGKNPYSGRDICRIQLLDERKYFFGTETTLMFRSDIVRQRVPFWQGKSSFCWDGETCYQILRSCHFGFVFSPLSFTRRENFSFKASLARFNPDLFARFVWFKVYGKDYLSHEEYRLKEKDISRKYYLYLAQKLTSPGVMSFHKKELRHCGIEFQSGLLVKYAMWQLVFAPMRTLKRALSKFA
jgi:hypothetical protein